MKTLEQEALLRLLQKHHIRELENIMADIATLTIKPTTITWNCGLGSMIITTEKAQEILNEHPQTLEQEAEIYALDYADSEEITTWDMECAFKAGAEWQKKQDLLLVDKVIEWFNEYKKQKNK